MPLHLLGKKSWNVYNAANIERVRRDEEAAAAREAAEDQRTQEEDAERRMRRLRGLPVDDIAAPAAEPPKGNKWSERRDDPAPSRKRRRIAGEDDTDRDIRYVQEDRELALQRAEQAPRRKPRNVPLTDAKGNINLFADEATRRPKPANPDAAAEDAKKKREYEDQYTMRFSNAAGFKQDVGERPWYAAGSEKVEKDEEPVVGKDVWGNADPRRRERDRRRVAADDPMALMQRGVQGVRKVEKERNEWKREKRREVDELINEEKREEKKSRCERRHSRKHEDSDLEDFRLDEPDHGARKRFGHGNGHRRRHHHDRDGSRHRRHRSHDRPDSEGRSRSHRDVRDPILAA